MVGGFKLGKGASDVHLQILQWGVKERKFVACVCFEVEMAEGRRDLTKHDGMSG